MAMKLVKDLLQTLHLVTEVPSYKYILCDYEYILSNNEFDFYICLSKYVQ